MHREEDAQITSIHPNGEALYYPYIRFRRLSWVCQALLYWDRITRIVPSGSGVDDTWWFHELRQADLIRDHLIYQPPDDVRDAFLALISDERDALRERYALPSRLDMNESPTIVDDAQVGRSVVFGQKLGSVGDALVDAGLARRARDGYRYYLHDRLADVYMMSLADSLSQTDGYEPLTDDGASVIAVHGDTLNHIADLLLTDRPSRINRETIDNVDKYLLLVSFSIVVPDIDFGRYSGGDSLVNRRALDQLIRFRLENRETLEHFRVFLRQLVDARPFLRTIEDVNALEQRLRQLYTREIEPRMHEQSHRWRRHWRVETLPVIASAVVATATSSAVVAESHHGSFSPIFLGLAAVSVANAVACNFIRVPGVKSTSPIAYLLDAQRAFKTD